MSKSQSQWDSKSPNPKGKGGKAKALITDDQAKVLLSSFSAYIQSKKEYELQAAEGAEEEITFKGPDFTQV